MVVSAHIAVMSAVSHSVTRVILKHTYVHIMVYAHIAVMCAVRHSLERVP